MLEELDAFLAAEHYHRCILLVSRDIGLLQRQAEELACYRNWPVLCVGSALSAPLISISPRQRSRTAQLLLRRRLDEAAPGPLMCTDIDLLFEPTLQLDPLALFRRASRSLPLIVAWPGHYDGGVLSYAVPEHAHYRTWPDPQVRIYLLEQ